jgi:hypothetical protein
VYLDDIKGLSDGMAAAGKPLDNLDVISHILSGLDEEYDGFVAAITALIKAWNLENPEMVHQLTGDPWRPWRCP